MKQSKWLICRDGTFLGTSWYKSVYALDKWTVRKVWWSIGPKPQDRQGGVRMSKIWNLCSKNLPNILRTRCCPTSLLLLLIDFRNRSLPSLTWLAFRRVSPMRMYRAVMRSMGATKKTMVAISNECSTRVFFTVHMSACTRPFSFSPTWAGTMPSWSACKKSKKSVRIKNPAVALISL